MHRPPFDRQSNAKNPGLDAAKLFSTPIEKTEFASLLSSLGPFERKPKLAVALSGGADSLCLSLLCQHWCQSVGGTLHTLLIDHNLRPSAGLEARLVAKWMNDLGISFEILRWQADKPKTGTQAKARDARYALLETRCRELGILHLLTAHQFDDQTETVEMRAARISGTRGLAGMAAISERSHVRILRPLMSVKKSRLIATLRSKGQVWIEDPSNQDQRYERSRLRAGNHEPILIPKARHLAVGERQQLDQCSARFLAAHATPHRLGFISIDQNGWRTLDHELACLVLQHCIRAISGSVYAVGRRKVHRLLDEMVSTSKNFRRTMGGSIVTSGPRYLRVIREPVAVRDRIVLPINESVMWDGRFKLRYNGAIEGLKIVPPSIVEINKISGTIRKKLRHLAIPSAVLMSLPCVKNEANEPIFLGLFCLNEAISEGISVRMHSLNVLAGASFVADTVA